MITHDPTLALTKLTGAAPRPSTKGFTSPCPLCKKPGAFWFVAADKVPGSYGTKSHCGCDPDAVLRAITAAGEGNSYAPPMPAVGLGAQTTLPAPPSPPAIPPVELRRLSDPALADALRRLADAIERAPL